ncbi:hypothetical protein [Methylorubrum zatmanii]
MGRGQDPGGVPRTAKAAFSDLVLVCRKCAKRQGVDRKQLGRALKRALTNVPRETGTGKVRVVETGCLGPCPKRMLTVATPRSIASRRVILIDPALDTLGPEALGILAAPSEARSPAGAPSTGARDG